jgi:hypothetical protein
MFAKERESLIKLDLLQSLARSQRALARMLEQAADAGDETEQVGEEFRRNLAAIGRLQAALAEAMGLIRIRRIRKGAPGPVWLHPRLIRRNGPRGR